MRRLDLLLILGTARGSKLARDLARSGRKIRRLGVSGIPRHPDFTTAAQPIACKHGRPPGRSGPVRTTVSYLPVPRRVS
ncbi:hypothetical protein D3M70_08685 [Pseudomonas sp. LS-2]|nr:hypothetical protein D3M70_08685 [Pseudomonas sp. LS-2]